MSAFHGHGGAAAAASTDTGGAYHSFSPVKLGRRSIFPNASPKPSRLQVSASRSPLQELAAARHSAELTPPEEASRPIHVHLDHLHMGVGGDVSWLPCVYDRYLIPTPKKRLDFALWLVPVPPGKDSLQELLLAKA